ncbi:hypothetical protein AAHE18_13G171400 [Arachis hypogaea]
MNFVHFTHEVAFQVQAPNSRPSLLLNPVILTQPLKPLHCCLFLNPIYKSSYSPLHDLAPLIWSPSPLAAYSLLVIFCIIAAGDCDTGQEGTAEVIFCKTQGLDSEICVGAWRLPAHLNAYSEPCLSSTGEARIPAVCVFCRERPKSDSMVNIAGKAIEGVPASDF